MPGEFESPFSYDGMDMNPVLGYGADMGGSPMAMGATVPRPPMPPGMTQMREMSYLQRLGRMMPIPRSGPRGHVHSGATGVNNQVMPQFDQSSTDAANTALGEYGQHMPTNPNPNALFPNSGFFGNHPRFTGALEGAMFGAANTHSGDTIGENISNVMQGFIQGRQQRQGIINQQFEAPFQQADMMGRLRQMSDQHANVQSEMADRQSIMNFRQHQMDQDKDKRQIHFDQQGHPWMFNMNDESGHQMTENGLDQANFNKPVHQQQPPAALLPYVKALGMDPATMGPQDWQKAIDARVHKEAQLAGAKAGSREYASISAQVRLGMRDQTETYLENKRRSESGQPAMTAEETLAFRDNLPAVKAEATARGREKVMAPVRDQQRSNRTVNQAAKDKQAWMRKFEGNDNFWAARGIKPTNEKAKSDYYDQNHAATASPTAGNNAPSGGSALQQVLNMLKAH